MLNAIWAYKRYEKTNIDKSMDVRFTNLQEMKSKISEAGPLMITCNDKIEPAKTPDLDCSICFTTIDTSCQKRVRLFEATPAREERRHVVIETKQQLSGARHLTTYVHPGCSAERNKIANKDMTKVDQLPVIDAAHLWPRVSSIHWLPKVPTICCCLLSVYQNTNLYAYFYASLECKPAVHTIA